VPDIADMSMPEVLKTQGAEVDACALALLEMGLIKETIGRAVLDCQFCVTISDPRLPKCPLLAVSDHFQTITGYSREEVIGKNVATLLESDCKLRHLDKEQLRIAFESGEPHTKVLVHRRKTGELFLDLMDVRGLNVAHNPRTRENLWFLVCIQADVTHIGEDNIPADQMQQLHEVAECIRIALADRVAAMGIAGMLTQPSDSGKHHGSNLWCPLRAVRWRQDCQPPQEHVSKVRQVSFARSGSSTSESVSRQSTSYDFAHRQTTRDLVSEQDGDAASSSGVKEPIQQQQQQQQQQPPPQEAEHTLSMRPRWLHPQRMPAFVSAVGLLAAMWYLFRQRRRGAGAVS
jgi:PAS domain S-box-containing protein